MLEKSRGWFKPASAFSDKIVEAHGHGVGVLKGLGDGHGLGSGVGSTVGDGVTVGVSVTVPVEPAVGDAPGVPPAVGEAMMSVKNAARSTVTVHGGTPCGPVKETVTSTILLRSAFLLAMETGKTAKPSEVV